MLRRVFALLSATALSLPLHAEAKTLFAPATVEPDALQSSVLAAQQAVDADTTRLLTLFDALREHAQSERGEQRLAEIIGGELSVLGFEVTLRAHEGAVVAILRNGRGPTLLYRVDTGRELNRSTADEDADAALSVASSTVRCGPDLHVAWMLGAAKAMVSLRSQWAGTLVVVSQPTRVGSQQAPEPLSQPGAPNALLVPKPDLLVVLRAAPAPIGAVLSVRGSRRPGTDLVDVSYEALGAYAGLDSGTRLALSAPRARGLPENVQFGYLLVGVGEPLSEAQGLPGDDAARGQSEDAEAPRASTAAVELTPLQLSSAAIPLGSKLATVALLELLSKTPRAADPQHSASPQRSTSPQRSASPIDLALHRY